MSRFDPLATRVQRLQASVDWLKALVEQAIDGSGAVRSTGGGGTDVGVLRTHEHGGTGEGGGTLRPKILGLQADVELTIAAGVVTATQTHHTIDTQSDDATDDLDTVNGLVANTAYVFYPAHTDRTIVVKHGTGNIQCIGNADFTLDDIHDFIVGFSPDGSTLYVMFGGGAGTIGAMGPPGIDGEQGEDGPPGPPGVVKVGAYGEISIDDNASGQTLDTGGTWYKITQFDTNGLSSGMTPDQANNKITVLPAGVYEVTFSCSFNGTASTVYHFDIYVNGVPQHHLAIERAIGTANDVGAVSIEGFISVGAGEDVEVYVTATGNSKSYLQGHANLNVGAVGGGAGAAGATGATGPSGSPGVDGADGDPGPPGADGAIGVDGADGATGQLGSPGIDGEQGEQGPPGLPGTRYAYRYTNVPDAAPGEVVVAGDAQGLHHLSGPVAEKAYKLHVLAKTAPGASGLPVTWQYNDSDDLDSESWTTIATYTLSSEKSNSTASMTNAVIPANRLMRVNWGTIVGSPADAQTILLTRPVA